MGNIERVTVTVDRELLSQVDGLVAAGEAKSRSHAFETLLQRGLATHRLRKALVLAGGTRKSLYSGSTMKPLLDVGGLTVIERIILQLKRAGVEEIFVGLGEDGEKIVSLLKNGESYGVNIGYLWEPAGSPLGGAGGMRLAQPHLAEPFLLSYSDVLYPDLDLGDLYRFHKSVGAACTLALTNEEKPVSFGVARLSGSRITDFAEKPLSAESHLVNAGVAVCEPSVFGFIPRAKKSSFEKDLLPALAKGGKLFGYVYSGKWFDVGWGKHLVQARQVLR